MDYTRLGRLTNWFTVGLFIGGILVYSSTVLAYCYTQTIITPDGRIMTCQTCCTSAGLCDTYCF